MGCSYNQRYQTDNEVENLFRDILFSLNLQGFNFLSVVNLISSNYVEKDGEKIYTADQYNELINGKFVDLTHDYKKFHIELFPEFEFLFDGYLKEKPEYNFLIWSLPYLRDQSKWIYIRKILDIGGMTLTYGNFEDFLEHYLTEALTNCTRRLNTVIQNMDTSYLVNNNVIASSFKNNANLIEIFYSKHEYIVDIQNTILKDLRLRLVSELSSKEDDYIDIKSIVLDSRAIDIMEVEYDWIFNMQDLRSYYWDVYAKRELLD